MNNKRIHGTKSFTRVRCVMHGNKKTLQNYPPLFCVRGTLCARTDRRVLIERRFFIDLCVPTER